VNNYICIEGKKIELTEEQLRTLGIIGDSPDKPEEVSVEWFAQAVRNGEIRNHYTVGDTVILSGYECKIIGIDHETLSSGEQRPNVTLMNMSLLPGMAMFEDDSGAAYKGWVDSDIREYLNGDYYDELAEELTSYIETVEKVAHNSKGEKVTTSDDLFVLSESELFGSAIYGGGYDGDKYEIFKTSDDRIMTDGTGSNRYYWTRSASRGNSTGFVIVHSGGLVHDATASNTTVRVAFGFTIA